MASIRRARSARSRSVTSCAWTRHDSPGEHDRLGGYFDIEELAVLRPVNPDPFTVHSARDPGDRLANGFGLLGGTHAGYVHAEEFVACEAVGLYRRLIHLEEAEAG